MGDKKVMECGQDEISKLPDEILLHIFSFIRRDSLGGIARVSKRWCQVAYDVKLWRSVIYGEADVVEAGELDAVLARGCVQLGLMLNKFKRPLFTRRLMEDSYKLERLSIDGTDLTMREFNAMLSHCTHLRHLYAQVSHINDETCLKIARNTNMHEISLSCCKPLITHEGLLAIARGCKRLVEFCMDTGDEFRDTSHDDLVTLVNELPSTISNLTIFHYNKNFGDEHMRLLVKQVPNLEELALEGCDNLTGKTVEHIVHLKQLIHLDIIECNNIPFADLQRLQFQALLPNLLVLNVLIIAQGETRRGPGARLEYKRS